MSGTFDELDLRLRDGVRDLTDHAPEPPSWQAVQATRPPGDRLLPAAAVLVLVALIIGVGTLSGRGTTTPPAAVDGGTTDAPVTELVEAGGFGMEAEALPDPGLGMREGSAGVWTGSEYLVWGGWRGGTPANDGAAYDPSTKTWRPIPPAPIAGRRDHVAVWTGDEMIVWGGSLQGKQFGPPSYEGAAYDPAAGTWRRLADAPADLPVDVRFNKAVWLDGRLVVVAAGHPGAGHAPILVYDAASDEWATFDVGLLGDVAVTTSGLIGVLAGPNAEERMDVARIDPTDGSVNRLGSLDTDGYNDDVALASDGRHAIVVVPTTAGGDTRIGWFDVGASRWTRRFRAHAEMAGLYSVGMHPDPVADQAWWIGGELALMAQGYLMTIDPETATLAEGAISDAHCVTPNQATVWTGREWFTFGGLGTCFGATVAGHAARVTFEEPG